MLQLLETGRALYVLAAICLLGIVTRGMTRHLYKRLLKESANMALTKNKSLKELRQRAENTYRINQGMRDSGSWLERQLYELQVMGMSLQSWSNLCMQWTWLCLLAGGISAFLAYWYRLDTFYIVLYGGGAVLMAMLTMMFDSGAGAGWREQLLVTLQDYLDNVLCPRLSRGMNAEGVRSEVSRLDARSDKLRSEERSPMKSNRNEPAKRLIKNRKTLSEAETAVTAKEESESDSLRRSLEQIAASREKSRSIDVNWLKDLKPEEVELIGDILKQYLS